MRWTDDIIKPAIGTMLIVVFVVGLIGAIDTGDVRFAALAVVAAFILYKGA